MEEIILTIAKQNLSVLGSIRDISGLNVAEDEELIWVRGINSITQELLPVRQLPVRGHYTIDKDGLLFPVGSITPVGLLRELVWRKISEFVTIELPSSAGPGDTPGPLAVSLIASAQTHPGAALLVPLNTWKAYGETASGVRLSRLRFAVSEKDEVLILGEPLPPLPGREYWLNGFILVPSGYDLEFPLMAPILQQVICREGSVTILNTDGSWSSIDDHFFVPATRTATRMTQSAQLHGEAN